jgi:hemerythrin
MRDVEASAPVLLGGAVKVVFSDSFLTGHPEIDREHREIFEIINSVGEAIAAHEFSMCHRLAGSFLEVCRDHFVHEESILADLKFPRLAPHATFHAQLLEKAEAIRDLCERQSDPDHLGECFNELVHFFLEDVVKGDLDFVSFLIEKGVATPRPCAPALPQR